MADSNYESHFRYHGVGSDNFNDPLQPSIKSPAKPQSQQYPNFFTGFPNPDSGVSHMSSAGHNYPDHTATNTSPTFSKDGEYCGIDQSRQYMYDNAVYNQSDALPLVSHIDHVQQYQSHTNYHSNHSNQIPCDQSDVYPNPGQTSSMYYPHGNSYPVDIKPDISHANTLSMDHHVGNPAPQNLDHYKQSYSGNTCDMTNPANAYSCRTDDNFENSYSNARNTIAGARSRVTVENTFLEHNDRPKPYSFYQETENRSNESMSQNYPAHVFDSNNTDFSAQNHSSGIREIKSEVSQAIVNEMPKYLLNSKNTVTSGSNSGFDNLKYDKLKLEDSNVSVIKGDDRETVNSDNLVMETIGFSNTGTDSKVPKLEKNLKSTDIHVKVEFDTYPDIKTHVGSITAAKDKVVSLFKSSQGTSPEQVISSSQDAEPEIPDIMSIVMKRHLGGTDTHGDAPADKRRRILASETCESAEKTAEKFDNENLRNVDISANNQQQNPLSKADPEKEKVGLTSTAVSDANFQASINLKNADVSDTDSQASQGNVFFLSSFQSLQGPDTDESTSSSSAESGEGKENITSGTGKAEECSNVEADKTVEELQNADDENSQSSTETSKEIHPTVDQKHLETDEIFHKITQMETCENVLDLGAERYSNDKLESDISDNSQSSGSACSPREVNVVDSAQSVGESSKPIDSLRKVTAMQPVKIIGETEEETELQKSTAESSESTDSQEKLTTMEPVQTVGKTGQVTAMESVQAVGPTREVTVMESVYAGRKRGIEAVISTVLPQAATSYESDRQDGTDEDDSSVDTLASSMDKSDGKLVVKIFKKQSKESTTGFEHKKSRKQHMPKRVYRTFPIPNNHTAAGSCGISQTISPDITSNPNPSLIHVDAVGMVDAAADGIPKSKHEKPRKQTIPKRFINCEQKAFVPELKQSPVKPGIVKSDKKSKSGKSRKLNIPKRIKREDKESYIERKDYPEMNEENESHCDDLDNYSGRNLSENDLDGETEPHYSKYFELNKAMEIMGGRLNAEKDEDTYIPPKRKGKARRKKPASPNVAPLPVQGGIVENLMKNVCKTDPNALNTSSAFDANLDIVRKLREIRFNRYRKISITEKKTIAAYAKIHGVSVAANHHGVSKSAVSLWTRMEFKDSDEDLEKRRRNCMLGNDKFESLITRVKAEKANKFKGLSREDKYEVSKYAKLVGVREMARCLDIALGTVSGWMRQFPYIITPANEDANGEASTNQIPLDMSCESVVENEGTVKGLDDSKTDLIKPENIKKEINDGGEIQAKEKRFEKQEIIENSENYGLLQFSALNSDEGESELKNEPVKVKIEPNSEVADNEEGTHKAKDDMYNDNTNKETRNPDIKEAAAFENQSAENVNTADESMNSPAVNDAEKEVEKLIAQTYVQPDVDKCWEGIQDLINGSILENDKFFESLFRRLTTCRIDKYKTLKASEKLEIVRYAKRVGVRRIAKIMDLATGTLSGWINKYQDHLGLTMYPCADGDKNLMNVSDLNESGDLCSDSLLSKSFGNASVSMTQSPSMKARSSAILDEDEKGEVTALKFLLKDQFSILSEKIDIAKTMKFRNMTPADKMEIVKCAKLVGIRPTARVFSMPIGTLSGWITKYSQHLESAFQGDVQKGGRVMDLSYNNISEHAESGESDGMEKPLSHSSSALHGAEPMYPNETVESAPSAYSKMMQEFARSSRLDPPEEPQTQIPLRKARISWPKMDSLEAADESSLSKFMPSVKLPNGYESSILDSSFNIAIQRAESHEFSGSESTGSSQGLCVNDAGLTAAEYLQQTCQMYGYRPNAAYSQ